MGQKRKEGRLTMMQRRHAVDVSRVHGGLVVKKKTDHWHGTHGGGAVQRELLSFIFLARRGFVGDQFAGRV